MGRCEYLLDQGVDAPKDRGRAFAIRENRAQ